jgi:hypothetical protein
MKEREYSNRDEFGPASSGQILAVVNEIEGQVPTATTREEYFEKTHQLLHQETRRFSVKRGNYMNGFVPFDGASIEVTTADFDLSERTERWNIWKEKGKFKASRLHLPSDTADDEAYAESVVFQRMLGLNVVSGAEAKKMIQMLKEAVIF